MIKESKCEKLFTVNAMARTVHLLRHDTYTIRLHCPIKAKIIAGDNQLESRIFLFMR